MNVWLIMIALAIGTFLIRVSFILLLGTREINPLFSRALRFVPASVLSALVVPQILTRDHSILITFANPQLLAGITCSRRCLADEERPAHHSDGNDRPVGTARPAAGLIRKARLCAVPIETQANRGITSLMNSRTPSVSG